MTFPKIARHFVPTQTVLYEFMTQWNGTVHGLHQMLLKIRRESDLMRRLAYFLRKHIKLIEISQSAQRSSDTLFQKSSGTSTETSQNFPEQSDLKSPRHFIPKMARPK